MTVASGARVACGRLCRCAAAKGEAGKGRKLVVMAVVAVLFFVVLITLVAPAVIVIWVTTVDRHWQRETLLPLLLLWKS